MGLKLKKNLEMSKKVDMKNVVLCETTNRAVSDHATRLLVRNSIPFSTAWKRIPILKRSYYQGASKVCVISINRNEYGKARRTIENLDRRDRDRLLLNVI